MTRIVLEEVFEWREIPDDNPTYEKIGEIVVYTESLTPNFINDLKDDFANKMGWKKKHKAILRKEGYDV